MTKCSRCGKPFESNGYKTCPSCHAYSQQYHSKNREVILPKLRAYNHTNSDVLRSKGHEYYIKNRERICAKQREYYKNHREEISEYFREYNPKRRKLKQIYNKNREALKKGSGGTFTFKELNELFEKQEGFCFYCGELLYSSFDKDIHIDHKIPISRGGTNDISNIALSCARCNLQKGTKTHEEFLKMV